MSAAARKHELPEEPHGLDDTAAEQLVDGTEHATAHATEYATRGARGHRSARPHLQIVSPLRPERASRGMFAVVVGGVLVLGMVAILLINTTLAQGAFTISELQARQAGLAQQEQALAEDVAAASVPRALEKQARSMGMVPSENPVFLQVPSGRILGKPKPAGGARSAVPTLVTPADATVTEAVDNGKADLPESVPVGYDPAAAHAEAAAKAGSADAGTKATGKKADGTKASGKKADAKKGKSGENGLWQDSTVIDVTGDVASTDAGLSAVPVN